MVAPQAHLAWRSIVPGVLNAISTCEAPARAMTRHSNPATTAPTASAARRPFEAFARYVRPPPKQTYWMPRAATMIAGTTINSSLTKGATTASATAAAMLHRVGVASTRAAT